MTGDTNEALIARAQECEFYAGALAALGAELPAEDGELDKAIEEAVKRRNELAFPALVFGALQAGRKVDARHLAEGSALFSDPTLMCGAAWAMSGDVCGSLLRAVKSESLDRLVNLVALIVAAGWWKEKAAGPVPPELVAQARTLARQSRSDPFLQMHVAALSAILQDKSLDSILEHIGGSMFLGTVDRIVESLNGKLSKAPLSVIPEQPPPVEISGFTVRRAVPRIGRNDSCPCGSGKKYKRCCWDRDRERLRHSSDVAGMTREEVREHPEDHLTWERLHKMRSYELSRIDSTKVAAELREHYIDQLVLHGEHEAVARFFETVSGEELEWAWENAVDRMTERGEKELVTRMLRVAPPGAPRLGLGPELLLASEEDRRLLDKVEAAAREALYCPAHEAPVSLVYTLLSSAWPGLGVMLARGAIPIAPDFDGMVMMDELLKARDRMHLSVSDPLEAVWEHQMKLRSGQHESDALHEVQDRLDGKIREVEQLNLRLKTLENQMERQERLAGGRVDRSHSDRPSSAAAAAEAGGEEARREIRQLKTDLKQRHSERNALRHELQEALREVETLRDRKDADSEAVEAKAREDREEDALLSHEPETLGVQPIRVPVFPRKFHEQLCALPQPVSRSALAMIGRLAGGETAAFVGCKRLRMDTRVFRQRVGLWHRLLFRLEPGVLEVIDLVPRKDLERRIKHL